MREIKFKFYCEDSDTLSRAFTIEELVNGTYDWHGDIHKSIKNQYTGLKDKNGVEIYESDICRCLGGSEFNGHYEYNRIYEVKWQGSGLEMMIDNCGYGWNYSSGFDYIEVIGNIYENPELLN